MTATTTERLSTSAVMQAVCNSAHDERNGIVSLDRYHDLENSIPEQQAIELAVRELLAASRELVACYQTVPYPPMPVVTLGAAADAVERLIGGAG